jgi:hypothetical protein
MDVVTVESFALDIRPLTNTDVVTVEATNLNIRQLTNTDVVTVEATNLNIRQLTNTDVVTVESFGLDIRPLTNMDVVTVEATNLNIRYLTSVSDSISSIQTGDWYVRLNDGGGNSISHFDNALGVALYGSENGTTKTIVAVNSDGLLKTSVIGNDGTTDRILKTDTTGKLNVNTTPNPSTGTYMNINVGTTGQVIKNSAALLTSITASNLSGSMRYLRIYNKATAPTDSDDASGSVFLYIIPLQANSTITMSYPSPVSFGSGLAIRATVGVASGDTNAPGSNEVVVNVAYI